MVASSVHFIPWTVEGTSLSLPRKTSFSSFNSRITKIAKSLPQTRVFAASGERFIQWHALLSHICNFLEKLSPKGAKLLSPSDLKLSNERVRVSKNVTNFILQRHRISNSCHRIQRNDRLSSKGDFLSQNYPPERPPALKLSYTSEFQVAHCRINFQKKYHLLDTSNLSLDNKI